MQEILSFTKSAQKKLLDLTPETKEKIILDMAQAVLKNKDEILRANAIDLQNAKELNLSDAMIERLKLDDKKINSIVTSLKQTAILRDPVGKILDGWVNHAGLKFQKVAIPIGVVCVIYESRPEVTAEVAALCFKSANASVLKGGKEAINSNLALVNAIKSALKENNVDENAITFINSTSRQTTQNLVKMDKYIDVIVPRGGSGLINFVCENSTIPVIKHDKGVCHIFIDESANLGDAVKISLNAKTQKPSACNAVETILLHENLSTTFLPVLAKALNDAGVKIFGCQKCAKIITCDIADEENFYNEYLSLALNIKIVSNVNEACEHIAKFGSSHSESIISQNSANIDLFSRLLDSACIYVNTSTRFSDGFEFGFGAEVGISTNKLHARGPMGLNELTTYKYIINGNGQIRK